MARKKTSSKKPKGVRVEINRKEQEGLTRSVLALYDEMAKDVDKTLTPLFETRKAKKLVKQATDNSVTDAITSAIFTLRKRWNKKFARLAEDFTKDLVSYSKSATARGLNRALDDVGSKQTIKVNSMSQRTRDILAAASSESVDMIKTISDNYMDSAKSALNYSVTQQSASMSELKDFFHNALKTQYRTHKNKAKNLAYDQTTNVFSSLTYERMRDAGMTKYIWRHRSGSKQPRKYHKDVLNGQIFDINDPPVIDQRTGQRGNPGQTYHCGCYAQILVDFD